LALITINIKERIASLAEEVELVCNNPTDTVQFVFDSEWDSHELKTARFSWQRKFIDIPFSGDTVNVPDIDKTNSVEVGVYTDNLTSTAVKIPCKFSIKSHGSNAATPTENQYDDIVQLINENAVRGPDGYTPIRGVDYWTENDISAIQSYVDDAILEGKW